MESLLLLASNWERMYAYILEDPRPFTFPLPIRVTAGSQTVQCITEEQWRAALEAWEHRTTTTPNSSNNSSSIRLLGLCKKDAFRILDLDTNLLLKTQKLPPGELHLGIWERGTAVILAKTELTSCRELRSLKAVRQMVSEGYEHHLDEQSRPFHVLRGGMAGKQHGRLYGWALEGWEHIQPPLRWTCVPWTHISTMWL